MTQILVVEDDPNVRTLVIKLLKAEGFDVISATDGLVGVQLARANEPDLIICDIMMPECNGYEVLEQLRQSPNTATIPFIFLSAKSDRTDLRQGMDLGADDYLTKPFKRVELLGAVSARLAKQAAITEPYIAEMKRAAQTLNQLAYRDPLTNLPNRIMLHHQLQDALKRAKRSPQTIAIFNINLDRFQAINTNLGYSVGDLLLKAIAERLSQAFSAANLVARLGGDEFCVLLDDAGSQADMVQVAQTMIKLVAEPYNLDGHYIQILASIGIAPYPNASSNPDRLLHQADTAMRHAKKLGVGKYEFYAVEMDTLVAERQAMEADLHLAFKHSEFELYYQPQVNMITGRIIGAEALLRWHHPKLGLVPPDKFISIAEETGLIIPLGEWVLKTACAQAKAWQEATQNRFRMSVNLSARQFKQEGLVKTIAAVLEADALEPDVLVLELTETCVMENVEASILTLQELKQMGIHISIDDFGTGYSSLNYLKRFPIDTLKIDQSFVREVTTDPNDAAIAKAIIAMAQSLQIKVVAEGIETSEQSHFLRQSGCHAMQGFLFSRPVPAEEFEKLLMSDVRLRG